MPVTPGLWRLTVTTPPGSTFHDDHKSEAAALQYKAHLWEGIFQYEVSGPVQVPVPLVPAPHPPAEIAHLL